MEHCIQGIEEEVPFLHHCPKVFISAKTGRNVEKIFPLAQQVNTDSKKRITTHQLNKFVGAAMQKNHPPMLMGKRLRIYYMAQVGIEPPKFVFFVNFPNLMADSYRKYLYNQFREEYGFVGVPILFYLKGKKRVNVEHDKAKADAKDEEEFSHPETDEEAFDEEPEDFVDFDDEE
jgi:GTP-binding protein